MIASSAVLAAAPTGSQTATGSRRYLALDAYRGFIMLLLASEGFGFSMLKGDPTWGRVAGWFDHVPWEGLVFWDLIQPAFMFMVGVAMPFALAARRARGASERDNFRHVLARSLRLALLPRRTSSTTSFPSWVWGTSISTRSPCASFSNRSV